jgi:uncharacterized protein YcfJ
MHEKKGPNGFLIGLLIGGAVGALISTKKGRQILKDIADYGLDYIGNTINVDEINTILNEEEDIMEGEMEAEKSKKAEEKASNTEEPSRRRRIFRGIKKK